MDIKPPPKRRPRPTPQAPQPAPAQMPKIDQTLAQEPKAKPPTAKPEMLPAPDVTALLTSTVRKRGSLWKKIAIGIILLIVIGVSCIGGYYYALSPKTGGEASKRQRVTIETGETSTTIAAQLEKSGIIRSALAMRLYVEMSGNKNKLQAGGYLLSTSQSVPEIVDHLVEGKTDEFNVRILPGFTLDELADEKVKGSLVQQGFSEQEIRAAYAANYSHPLLTNKPATADLEGYIFPETYKMNSDGTLESLFTRSFDELYNRMKKDGTLEAFQAQGLNIHQGITLASMVQKEVSNPIDQAQVAQVFLKRLSSGQVLGSDVTFFYAAKKMGVKGTPELDSPYNTRKYGGLPPGPIANMNYSAIQAVAHPAPGDYLFFVAGDGTDAGKTFFARTEEEHNANVAAHCHVLCQ